MGSSVSDVTYCNVATFVIFVENKITRQLSAEHSAENHAGTGLVTSPVGGSTPSCVPACCFAAARKWGTSLPSVRRGARHSPSRLEEFISGTHRRRHGHRHRHTCADRQTHIHTQSLDTHRHRHALACLLA